MSLLFVYGSLKQDYPNHPVNRGRRVPGEYRTAQAYPMHLIDSVLPCLFLQPGQGLPVSGQLFEVNADALAAMDALERVGEPGGYQRVTIDVVASDGSGALTPAFAYVQDAALLQRGGPHPGPLADYTPEHARALRW
ncbi:MAG: gamma-glutamylcyclotransferase [Hydrogenophaga sp.]|uniref:gamma-glutamylcyclotransferase family protein n=1 Tax=Hydrogenophaga sp. TaxID=1904254 RepID=UPI001D64E23B|nr:gamma-glutamylcyclotransferase family protein [Hydrogenophaga sp.]MBX3609704.1 gamma-glutamylcyclotransferase [Hydrogenophaga sp.]